jgi:hypothetical protein
MIETEATLAEITEHLLRDAGDVNVVVGPVGQNTLTANRPYFMVATCNRQQQFRCDQVLAGTKGRASLPTLLCASRG